MTEKLALTQTNLGTNPVNGIGGLSNTADPFGSVDNTVSFVIGLLTSVAALWFLFLLFTGGLSYLSAGGDKGKVEQARQTITTGIVGLVVVIAAVFILSLIGTLLGIDFLSLGSALSLLAP